MNDPHKAAPHCQYTKKDGALQCYVKLILHTGIKTLTMSCHRDTTHTLNMDAHGAAPERPYTKKDGALQCYIKLILHT